MSVGTNYKAVIVVGLTRSKLIHCWIDQIIKSSELEDFVALRYAHSDTNVVGLRYVETPGFDSAEFIWDEEQILKLKNKFLMLTGLEAKVYLSTGAY